LRRSISTVAQRLLSDRRPPARQRPFVSSRLARDLSSRGAVHAQTQLLALRGNLSILRLPATTYDFDRPFRSRRVSLRACAPSMRADHQHACRVKRCSHIRARRPGSAACADDAANRRPRLRAACRARSSRVRGRPRLTAPTVLRARRTTSDCAILHRRALRGSPRDEPGSAVHGATEARPTWRCRP